MAALTIYYAGVDITDYVRQETIRIESSGSALAAICRLVAEDRLGQEPWFNPADKSELIIYDGATRIFGGWANIVDAQHDGPFRGFPIRASDYTVQLEEHIVVDTYTAAGTSDQALIQEMFANWCTPIDATVHVQVVRAAMPEMHFRSILIRQAMDNICRKSGGMYYVDFDKRLHYFLADEGVSAPDILSTEPDEVTRWPYQLKRRRFDASKLCNNVLVIGNGIEVWREHAASIAHYDFRYQDTLQDGNVDTAEEAEYLGDWYLARHAWPNETLKVTCWRPGLRAGQNIRLINSVLGIDQFYSIRKAVITCTGAYEPDSPQFIVRLTLGLQDAPGRPDFEPPPHRPLPPPVPPPPVPPPDAGWRKEVWVATKDLGPFYTTDFVTDTRYAHGVPTWTAVNTGLTLVGEDCLGFRGDPFDPQTRQYCLMTDGLYRRVAPGNWVSVLTWAAAQAAAGGNHANSHFGRNGLEPNINREGEVNVLFNARHAASGYRAVMFQSLDFGANWTMKDISGWVVTGAKCNSLTIGAYRGSSPYEAGQAMYAIGRRGGIFANTGLWSSVDGGNSWSSVSIGASDYTAHCLVDPNDQSRVFVGCLNGVGPLNVGVSLDHGATVAQYDAAASEDLGKFSEYATYYHLSVAMEEFKIVRVGGQIGLAHIHTTRDNGVRWEETTPEFSEARLGISIVQDAPNFLYLLRQSSGTATVHVIYASENDGRDMIPKAGANQHIDDTGGGDSIPNNCGGVRGILQIWTDRAEGDVPGVPVEHDIGRHPGVITPEQLLPHDLLSAFHSDTLAAAVTRGSLIVGNGTPRWSELGIGGAGLILVSDGVDVAWGTLRAITVNDAAPGLTITQAGAGAALSLPTATTAAKGLILGGDVVLFRSAADLLETPDSLRIGGDLFGPAAAVFEINPSVAQNVRLWRTIGAGNPYFFLYGWDAGAAAVRYGRFQINPAGDFNIQAEELLLIQSLGSYARILSAAGQLQYFDAGGLFTWRDRDAAYVTRMTLDSATGELKLYGNAEFGDPGTNYLAISATGVVTLHGTAKRVLTLRPEINVDEIKKQAVPDQVQIGVFFGYSMPIYAADHEELYLTQSVPARWDEASDIIVHLLVCLSGAEDVGDHFQFQLSWNNVADSNDIVPAVTHDVTTEQAVLAGRAAQYDVYELLFTVDYDADGPGNEVAAHDVLAYRLRRIDATDPDVANEIIVLDWHDHFDVDKMFKAP